MTIRTAIAAGALLAAVASASAFAQGSMSTMSKADMDKMAACKAMTKDAMMKDAKCVSLSKMQSGGMKSDSTTNKGSMGAATPMAGPQSKDKMGPMAPSK